MLSALNVATRGYLADDPLGIAVRGYYDGAAVTLPENVGGLAGRGSIGAVATARPLYATFRLGRADADGQSVTAPVVVGAVASPRPLTLSLSAGQATASGAASAATQPVGVLVGMKPAEAVAGALAAPTGLAALMVMGAASARGVQNPTDEELAVLLLELIQ